MAKETNPTGPSSESPVSAAPTRRSRATQFFLKGLAITLPPILTLVILIWIAQILYAYVISPTSELVRLTLAWSVQDSRPTAQLVRADFLPPLEDVPGKYVVTPDLRDRLTARMAQPQSPTGPLPANREVPVEWIRQNLDDVYVPFGASAVPYHDYAKVAQQLPPHRMPTSAIGIYKELVTIRYFGNLFFLSAVAVSIAVVALYFVGGLFTARLGTWAVHKVESVFVQRVPLVSNVYSSVKQVTDFFFTERTVSYNRVVALEYPRRGIWTIAFVTSDSLLEITVAANEPLITVLVPTSPMPMTGFTVSVPRSEVVDLNLTIDQAFQFCLSCGVLVPPHQRVTPEQLQRELAKRFAQGPPPIGALAGGEASRPSGNGPTGAGSNSGVAEAGATNDPQTASGPARPDPANRRGAS
ncbi:MAG: DUF502 domain-containing protein [Planctomycetales bacterium]